MRIEQGVGPLPHRCGFSIADDHARQIVIFGADKRIISDEGVFELADIGFQLDPESRVFGFLAQFGRRHVGQVQLAQLDDAARDDQPRVLRRETDLFA